MKLYIITTLNYVDLSPFNYLSGDAYINHLILSNDKNKAIKSFLNETTYKLHNIVNIVEIDKSDSTLCSYPCPGNIDLNNNKEIIKEFKKSKYFNNKLGE